MTAPAALRSMLFVPGDRPDRVAKAAASGADAIIYDLEDAVAESRKQAARDGLADLPTGVPVHVRVNGAETPWLWDDVTAAGAAPVAGIVLPKADRPDLVARIDGALTVLELSTGRPAGSTQIVPLIENARGILRTRELCEASPRVRVALFGSGEEGDLVTDLGCEWTPEGTGLLTARGLFVLATRAAGVQPMDAVFMDLGDDEALRRECLLARRMGCVGKVAIHPKQLAAIHDVFTPTDEEVAAQRRILQQFEDAVAAGSAAVAVDGRMVDYAVAARARSVLARARPGGQP